MNLAGAKCIFNQLGGYVTSTCHVIYRWRGEKKEASEERASMFRMVLLVRQWTKNQAEEFD